MTIELKNVKEYAPLDEIKEFFDRNIPATHSRATYAQFFTYYHSHCFLATDGQIVGAILAESREGCGYIALLAVEPAYRNQRIATKLLFACIDSFLNNNCRIVFLETPTNNIASVKLYEKFRFTKVEIVHNFYSNGDDAYRFKLNLVSDVSEWKESVIDRAYNDLHGRKGQTE